MLKQAQKKSHKGKVLSVREAAQGLFYITIQAENFTVKAGQFISILCGDLTLRRPFSVMEANNGTFTVLFKQKGKGTKYMSNLREGDEIDFIGAFGNGFTIENKKALLIAAGVGSAPINFLRNTLDNEGIENRFISGFLNKDSIPEGLEFDRITTDDGSFGDKGSILNYVAEEIQSFNPEKIYACGPEPVLKKLCEFGENFGIETEIAMEKEMACSIGVCRGCVIQLKNGKNASVCKDGPVFKGSEIKW